MKKKFILCKKKFVKFKLVINLYFVNYYVQYIYIYIYRGCYVYWYQWSIGYEEIIEFYNGIQIIKDMIKLCY